MSATKNIRIATIGTLLEWAEFTFYAYIAPQIANLFFPASARDTALIATFAVFAVGYLMRPLGSLVFGYLGDKYGRKLALQLSILLMGFATCSIGLLPGYNQIGLFAPLLLVLCRSLQGFAVGGEFNGSAIFLIEHAKSSPVLAGSWTGWAAGMGMLIGSLTAAIVVLPGMPGWCWRIPFLLGAFTSWYALYLRREVQETPDFNRAAKASLNPIVDIFKHHRSGFMIAIMLSLGLSVYVYTGNIFYVSYLSQVTQLTPFQTKIVVSIGEALVVAMFPFAAMLGDRVGTRPLLITGFSGFIFIGPLIFWAAHSLSYQLIILCQLPFAIVEVLFAAPIFKYLQDLFPVHSRYTGISLAWSISTAIFGGTSPIIAQWLWQHYQTPLAPGLYMGIAGMIAAITVIVSGRAPAPVPQGTSSVAL